MPEFYYVCIGSFVIGLLIGMGSRLWNMPVKRPRIVVGDMVHMRDRHRAGEFRVIGECCASSSRHFKGRSLFVQRVASGKDVGGPSWVFEWELDRVVPLQVVA